MLHYALVFLVVGLIAAALGLSGVAGVATRNFLGAVSNCHYPVCGPSRWWTKNPTGRIEPAPLPITIHTIAPRDGGPVILQVLFCAHCICRQLISPFLKSDLHTTKLSP